MAVSRRAFVLGLSTGLLSACSAVTSGITAARVPLVDFHAHLQKRISVEEILGYMDRSNVTRTVLMALYYGDGGGAVNDGEGTDEQALEYARRFPTRFVPFVGMQRGLLVNRQRWLRPDGIAEKLLAETQAKLETGAFYGMGEFMLRFYPYTTELGIVAVSDMDYPADSPLMRHFAALSARYQVPMVIHCEAEPEAAAAMVRLIELHPDAIVVWAHNCGRSSAARIRELLSRYPNLYADLGLMVSRGGGYGTYWPRRMPWMSLVVTDDGTILPEMKALFEEFPNRFFLGNDRAHARAWIYHPYLSERWRLFLSQLSSATAGKIALENAEQMFRRKRAA